MDSASHRLRPVDKALALSTALASLHNPTSLYRRLGTPRRGQSVDNADAFPTACPLCPQAPHYNINPDFKI